MAVVAWPLISQIFGHSSPIPSSREGGQKDQAVNQVMSMVGVFQQPPQQPTATLFTASRDDNSSSEDKQTAEDTGRSYSALFSGDSHIQLPFFDSALVCQPNQVTRKTLESRAAAAQSTKPQNPNVSEPKARTIVVRPPPPS
ncbi:hypothetical protein V492_05823 [Pseudogymnoascus sp. VKM F-4246]|nr:hypothetical protein V492_05823 [Pseudogymnoascus sp. VKM F-4246]